MWSNCCSSRWKSCHQQNWTGNLNLVIEVLHGCKHETRGYILHLTNVSSLLPAHIQLLVLHQTAWMEEEKTSHCIFVCPFPIFHHYYFFKYIFIFYLDTCFSNVAPNFILKPNESSSSSFSSLSDPHTQQRVLSASLAASHMSKCSKIIINPLHLASLSDSHLPCCQSQDNTLLLRLLGTSTSSQQL